MRAVPAMRYIANARMYSVAPPAKAAWNELLAWVLQRAGLDWDVIDHAGTLDALWSRNDLGCVMMCGLPLSMRRPQPRVIAAPIPAPARFDGPCITLESNSTSHSSLGNPP